MISSTVSFSKNSQCDGAFWRNNFLNIGESKGFFKSRIRLFLTKLKKADRWAYLILLVPGFRPSVILLRNERISSGVIAAKGVYPNSLEKMDIIDL